MRALAFAWEFKKVGSRSVLACSTLPRREFKKVG